MAEETVGRFASPETAPATKMLLQELCSYLGVALCTFGSMVCFCEHSLFSMLGLGIFLPAVLFVVSIQPPALPFLSQDFVVLLSSLSVIMALTVYMWFELFSPAGKKRRRAIKAERRLEKMVKEHKGRVAQRRASEREMAQRASGETEGKLQEAPATKSKSPPSGAGLGSTMENEVLTELLGRDYVTKEKKGVHNPAKELWEEEDEVLMTPKKGSPVPLRRRRVPKKKDESH